MTDSRFSNPESRIPSLDDARDALSESRRANPGPPSRRTFLATLGAAATVPLLERALVSAQAPSTPARRIDIHQHFVSPSFYASLNAKNATSPIPGLAAW